MSTRTSTRTESAAPAAAPGGASWVVLGHPDGPAEVAGRLRPRRLLLQLALGVGAVLVLVSVIGSLAAQRLAERESVNDAATRAGILAEAVVGPALTPALLAGRPGAVARFDRVVREQVLTDDIVRVKVWTADGTVVSADEPQLVGRRFPLDPEQRAAVVDRATHAEISRLDASENAFEAGDRLVEVYRPIWFPDGSPGLFEIYASYEPVGERSGQLWRGFAGITLSSLVLLLLLIAPIGWHLLRRLRRYEAQRSAWLERAVDASSDERRRIAATLHDGPVQELVATSYTVAGAAAHASNAGQHDLAVRLEESAGSVRTAIGALRGLLDDIYPAPLVEGGLVAGLRDLESLGGDTTRVVVHADAEPPGLGTEEIRRVFRLTRECVVNAVRHSGSPTVDVTLSAADGAVVVDVVDAGRGFDVPATVAAPEEGHLGLRLLADLASAPGVSVRVASAPGAGTHWRIEQRPGDGPP